MELGWICVLSAMILLYTKEHSSFDIGVSSVCEQSYYIQNKAGTEFYHVKINRTSYDCPALPSNNTIVTAIHTVSEIKLHYSLFYNEDSKRVEANISWELDLDMTDIPGYILQVQRSNTVGKETKKCLNIAVSKETGYFYGKHNFPTDISVRCLQVVSSNDDLYISVWPIMSKNCTCRSEKVTREPGCSRHCRNQEEINTVSYKFPFVHGACNYWSQYRRPQFDLVIRVKKKFDVFADILATNLNPYTSITLALFASDNPSFPLFEIHKNASTSLLFSKKIDHFENTTFYAVIYYFCNGSNSSATMSYMTPEVDVDYGKPVTAGKHGKGDKNNDTPDNKKNSYVLLSVMIGVTCIALGSVIAGFILFRNKLGCKQTTHQQDGSRETMLALPNNNITDIEESIYQPTVRFQTDPEDITFEIKDKT